MNPLVVVVNVHGIPVELTLETNCITAEFALSDGMYKQSIPIPGPKTTWQYVLGEICAVLRRAEITIDRNLAPVRTRK